MIWIVPSEKDTDNASLEKRLWDAADQFRAKDGCLSIPPYVAPTAANGTSGNDAPGANKPDLAVALSSWLKWQIPPVTSAQNRLSWVALTLDARTHRFKPVYSLKPSIPELESSIASWKDSDLPRLVVPELLSRVLDLCRQRRLAAIDLNGRAYLRAEGLLVDRRSLHGRDFRFELEPRNVFVGKSPASSAVCSPTATATGFRVSCFPAPRPVPVWCRALSSTSSARDFSKNKALANYVSAIRWD